MVNVSFHHCEEISQQISEAGHTLLFLPPYSPFMNLFNERNIVSKLLKLKRSSGHNHFRTCHDSEYDLIYVYTYKSFPNKTSDTALYLLDLAKNTIHILLQDKKEYEIQMDKIFCHHGLLIFTMVDHDGIWTRNHSDNNIFYFEIGRLKEMVISDHNPNDVALLTEKSQLFILDMIKNKWNYIDDGIAKARWYFNC
ncbi:hypothetical protein RF11_08014 [Thelohanellus kitauei]|uniref:Tc1-like transposase DDE domain-containing protein n=1 Tax=Thelohanellus kitauei TaxID=669202 RepID=A0A0C2MLN9_THEKT|nr:hypothetical protein RF11_08014 [Thelohanellus kitauei]